MESEKNIEKNLVKEVKERKGVCLKFLPYMANGFPDRIVILPGGKLAFIELKGEGQKLRKLQKIMFRKLEKLGANVIAIDKTEQIKPYLDAL